MKPNKNINKNISMCRFDAKTSMCSFDAMSTYTNSPDPTEATTQLKTSVPHRGNHSTESECSVENECTPPRQLWDNFRSDPTEAIIQHLCECTPPRQPLGIYASVF